MTKLRLLPLVVVCCLAACTGDDDPPAASSTTTVSTVTTVPLVTVPAPNLTASYFESLASGADSDAPGSAAALPGSEAAIYAEHQATARGLLGLQSTRTLVAAGQGFEICQPNDVCTAYGAVVTDPASGGVTSFSIDRVPLQGRIVGGGLVADQDGVVARVRSAYRSGDDAVFVLVEVDNTAAVAVELFGFAAVLEPGAGRDSVEASGTWGAGITEPGQTTDLLLVFESTELGGQLRLSGLRSDGLDVSLDLRVPTPA